MKKIIYSTLSVALLAVSISSCAKSSKGKMANEWKVTEFNSTETDTDSNGDQTVSTTSMTESTATMTTVQTSGGSSQTTTQSGTVNANEMTIDKDGTWTSTRDITSTQSILGTTATTNMKTVTSGTWAFVGKTKGDDFKKNERVLFNTLSETYTQVYTYNGSSQTSASTDTYLTGENVMIYTVTESKGKELALESEMSSSNTSTGGGTSSTKGTTTIKLAEK
ncbi:hypothetical protein [Fluviicola sp.]|uniref:hypothetical protein n=1 Tax=Fluviicola sp. TaxID=1917219 RepID=UPI003D2C0353